MMALPNPETLLENVTKDIKAIVDDQTAIVGIHRGGVWMMERILPALNTDIPHGTLDAALYRDDYAQRGLKNAPQPANIPFDVNNKHIILIDDIFYTGRTTRAAMNELFDYGRPAKITLCVLINRGGAQLPITPQIAGIDLNLTAQEHFKLSRTHAGQLQLALEKSEDKTNV